ncbi:MAG: hypothetical protein ACKVQS_02680 [Fimbriimonadaceae bacterium]
MRKTKLSELLKFKPAKGPGYEISPKFYLSVMAARMPLPSIRQIVEPKGADGAVIGFGVPMAGDKEDLEHPMERGAYVIASLDRKTVIRGLVISKEEAGFNPEGFLRSDRALLLSEEAKSRMASTWMLVQLTFESFDPGVHSATRLMYEVAARLAELSGGLVADPVSEVYKMPSEVLSPIGTDGFAVQDLVAVHSRVIGSGFGLFTLGMQKFGLPEFEIAGVGDAQGQAAARLLLGLCQGVLRTKQLTVGDSVGSKRSAFRIAAGGLDRGQWEGILVLEVIPENTEDVNSVLARWDEETNG